MKAIGYARVSTDEQTLQGVSLSHQEQKIRAYCIAKDFDAAVTNSALVVFDNADVKLDWLDDRLAIAATGGSIQKRVLYTDNKLADFPIRCFVGITSRTPEFRRDDVADRLLIMYEGGTLRGLCC